MILIPIDERRHKVIGWAILILGFALGLANWYWMEHYFQ